MIVRTALPALALMALAACSQQQTGGNTAEDFAARVGGPGQPAATAAPAVPQPGATGATEGAIAAAPQPASGWTGLALAPGAEACSAQQAAAYLNQPDSPAVRQRITAAAANASEIRFLPPGTADSVGPRTDRLNVMIDTTGIIRDLRCG